MSTGVKYKCKRGALEVRSTIGPSAKNQVILNMIQFLFKECH